MSQDVFHMWMDQATDCLPSIIAIHDDTCIYGHTPEKHDQHLLQLIDIASGSLRLLSMAQCSLPRACSWIPSKSKPSRTFLPLTPRLRFIPSPDWSTTCNSSFLVCSQKQCSCMNSLLSWTGIHLQMQLSSASKPGSARPCSMQLLHNMTNLSLS